MEKRERWEIVLMALYAEAIHCGSFAEVTSTAMGFQGNEFGWTLYLLQMRGLISGCKFQPPTPSSADKMMGVNRDELMLTPRGFEKAEALLENAEQSTGGQLSAIWEMLRDVGSGIMASIIYGWIK